MEVIFGLVIALVAAGAGFLTGIETERRNQQVAAEAARPEPAEAAPVVPELEKQPVKKASPKKAAKKPTAKKKK